MQKNTKTNWFQSHKKITIGIGIFLSLYFVSLFVPFIAPFTQYPLQIVRCGGLPIEGSTFAAGNSYTVPGTDAYRVDIFSDRYFCSEDEARDADFKKYDFSQN